MPVGKLEDIYTLIPPRGRLLGLDVGTVNIGVAICDAERLVTRPFINIDRGKFKDIAATLFKIIDDEQVSALIVGWPLNMDGSFNPRCQSVQDFAANVIKHRDMPIVLWDERWSTQAVEKQMIDSDVSRDQRARRIDGLAAAYILEGALARLKWLQPLQ